MFRIKESRAIVRGAVQYQSGLILLLWFHDLVRSRCACLRNASCMNGDVGASGNKRGIVQPSP